MSLLNMFFSPSPSPFPRPRPVIQTSALSGRRYNTKSPRSGLHGPRHNSSLSPLTSLNTTPRSPSTVQLWDPSEVAAYVEANAPQEVSPQIASLVEENHLSGHTLVQLSDDDILSIANNDKRLASTLLDLYHELRGPVNFQRRRQSIKQLTNEFEKRSSGDSPAPLSPTVQRLQGYPLDHEYWSDTDSSESEDGDDDHPIIPQHDQNTLGIHLTQPPPITAEQTTDPVEPLMHLVRDARGGNVASAAIPSGSNVSSIPDTPDIDDNVPIPQGDPDIINSTPLSTSATHDEDKAFAAQSIAVGGHHLTVPAPSLSSTQNLLGGAEAGRGDSVHVVDVTPSAPATENSTPPPQQPSATNDAAVSNEPLATDLPSDDLRVAELAVLSSLAELVSTSAPGHRGYREGSHVNVSTSAASTSSDGSSMDASDIVIPQKTIEGDVEHVRSPSHGISQDCDPNPLASTLSPSPDTTEETPSGLNDAVVSQPEPHIVPTEPPGTQPTKITQNAADGEGTRSIGSDHQAATSQPLCPTRSEIDAESAGSADATDVTIPIVSLDAVVTGNNSLGASGRLSPHLAGAEPEGATTPLSESTNKDLGGLHVQQPDLTATSCPPGVMTSTVSKEPLEQADTGLPALVASQAGLVPSSSSTETLDKEMGLIATPSSLLQGLQNVDSGETENDRLEPLIPLPLGSLFPSLRFSVPFSVGDGAGERHGHQPVSTQTESVHAVLVRSGSERRPETAHIFSPQSPLQPQVTSEHLQVGFPQRRSPQLGFLLVEDTASILHVSERWSLQYVPRSQPHLVIQSLNSLFRIASASTPSSAFRALSSTTQQLVRPAIIPQIVMPGSMVLEPRPSPPHLIIIGGTIFELIDNRHSMNYDDYGVLGWGDAGAIASSTATITTVDEKAADGSEADTPPAAEHQEGTQQQAEMDGSRHDAKDDELEYVEANPPRVSISREDARCSENETGVIDIDAPYDSETIDSDPVNDQGLNGACLGGNWVMTGQSTSSSRALADSFEFETPMSNQDTLVDSPLNERFDTPKFSPVPICASETGDRFFEDEDTQLVNLSDVEEEPEIVSHQELDNSKFVAMFGGDIFGEFMISSLPASKDKEDHERVIGKHFNDSVNPPDGLCFASFGGVADRLVPDRLVPSTSNEMTGLGDSDVGDPTGENFNVTEGDRLLVDLESVVQSGLTYSDVGIQADLLIASQAMIEERLRSAQRSGGAFSNMSTRRRAGSDPIPLSAVARSGSWSYPEPPLSQ